MGRYKVSEKGINIKNSEFVGNSTSAKYVSSTIMLTAWGNIGMPALEHRFEGTTFKNNKTTVSGGAIAVIYESAGNVLSNLKINNSSFEGNHAGKSGGAISLDFYDVEISNTEFKGNSSVESGGAINSHAKKLVLNDVVFTDNKSEENGGAIVLRETKPAMNDGNGNYSNVHQTIEAALNVVNHDLTYTGNKVTGDQAKGGFLYMESDAIATVNVADGRTLTIGKAGVVDAKTDSFATDATGQATLVKDGAGTMVVNSSMQDFNGTFDVAQGHVVIDTFNMPGVLSVDAEKGSAVVTVNKVADNKLQGTVKAANNGMVVFGANEATARAAMQKAGVTGKNGVIYVAKPMDMTAGSLAVGSGTQAADGQVVAAQGGVLMVDQAAAKDKPLFTNATVNVEKDATLTLVNASVGTVTLADKGATVAGNVTTDNPFIEGNFVDGKLVSSLNATDGLTSLASTGIQAMTRRADFVLAETIANRTAFDHERTDGVRLWVDVTGERYEADDLENGGNFSADAGYAAFGGDIEVMPDLVVGAAMQYGNGSLSSDVANIKNDITSYGLTGYVTKKLGDFKVVGELAYVQSENEITSSQAALNVDVDAKMYSAGVRAQYEMTAGNFAFIPSVGLRVSRLETDGFNAGTVRVDDQSQTLVQMPIALRVTAVDQKVDGWSLAPNFKVAFVPTFGDKEISMGGVDQTVIDTSPVQADFGVLARKGAMTLNADLLLGGGKDGTSSIGGKVGLNYAF